MGDTFEFDAVVIGAGVVGLALSYYLTNHDINTVLLEKNSQFGLVGSARNSQIIHAGIYYKNSESNVSKFLIVTKPADKSLEKIHSRMPMMISQNEENNWLNETTI